MYCNLNFPRFVLLIVASLVFMNGCKFSSVGQTQTNSPLPPVDSQNPQTQRSTWAWFSFPSPPAPSGRGGSRGSICLITLKSFNQPVLLWNDRPLVVWAEKFTAGSVDKVAITSSDNKEVWSRSISDNSSSASGWIVQQIAYDGKALQPGQNYTLAVLDALEREPGPETSGTFRMMAPEQRQSINAGLKALEDRLTREGATVEKISAEKAAYFAKQRLWADALQVTFSVENPSPELVEFRRRITAQLCDSSQ